MKQTTLLLSLVLMSLITIAQTEQFVESEIKNVTVYQQGAEITRQAEVDLKAGKTTLLFNNLSSKLDSRSIQAKGDNDLMIVSISQNIDYLNKVQITAEIEALENQRLAIKDSLSLLNGLSKVYQQEQEMILANNAIGGEDGVDIAELKNAASFFRERLTEIELKTKALEKQRYKLKLQLVKISRQLLELNTKSDAPTSIIKVVVSAKASMKYKLDLRYVVSNASWGPTYDLRITDVNEPLDLFYKAKVTQNTDEDWENVKLILSTGNPSISNYKPELSSYYLTFNNYYKKTNPTAQSNNPYRGSVRGIITDKNGEPLIGANVLVKGTTVGTVSDINGVYQIDNIPWDKKILVFSYTGFSSQEKRINSNKVDMVLNEAMTLDEVVVAGYSNDSWTLGSGASRATPKPKKEQIPLAIEKRQTSTEFEIEIPYSIPSDNKPYDVTMVEYKVDADYHYSAVPKLSSDAYLTAAIADWTQYEMISGSANLFFQGIYQGQTYLDLKAFEDTLTVSVGRDEDILISREIQRDFSKRSVIGANKKVLKSWVITVKNSKDIPVDLELEDQFPISKVANIKVEQLESSGAEINKDDGKLTWELKLQPKEKKVLIVKYEVKYPKNRNLIVD